MLTNNAPLKVPLRSIDYRITGISYSNTRIIRKPYFVVNLLQLFLDQMLSLEFPKILLKTKFCEIGILALDIFNDKSTDIPKGLFLSLNIKLSIIN